jgi:protocatechuate 3,4-dioxygenase beta subunit
MAVTLWSAWAIGLVTLMAQETPPEKCVFEGAARNNVSLLGLGQVTIRLIPTNGSLAYSGSSKADGSFRFEGIVPGDYRVEARRTGYSEQWVLADKSGRAISGIRLTPGQNLIGNNLWLTPDGAISGKVIAPDGEPLPSARIHLIDRKWQRGKHAYELAGNVTADDAGLFHFGSVPAGRYWVYAAGPTSLELSIVEAPGAPETRIAGRYFPNASQLDSAEAVEVHAGEEISGIDFKLPLTPVFHVGGAYSGPGEDIGIALRARHGDQTLDWLANGASVRQDGKFDIAGVPPGSYFLYASQFDRRDLITGAKLPVTVTTQDVGGLLAEPVTRFAIKGRVRTEGESASEKISILIFCDGGHADLYTSAQCRAEPQPDGTFTLTNLNADRYTIRIVNRYTGEEGGFYLKTVRVNGGDAPGHEIDLTGGPADGVELILSSNIGTVEGTVTPPENPPDSRAPPESGELTVVMIPEKLPSGATQPVVAYLDPAGHFQATDLEPGTYRAFAVPAYDQGLWQNTEFLRQIAGRGIALDVSEKANVKIELQALRVSEVRQMEDRVE